MEALKEQLGTANPASSSHIEEFRSDVLRGLGAARKTLPCVWLYDEYGSELFETITDLPEYYPTRTETGILQANAATIADFIGANARLVEYGAGASIKTRYVLDALQLPAGYVPIDVSAEFLMSAAESIRQDYPDLAVQPVVGSFLESIDLPEPAAGKGGTGRQVGFFPGSTIGNLSDEDIAIFLSRARSDLGDNGAFVLGFDLRKSPDILIPAYDDSRGVTAAFNLNLLTRINRELGADFDLEHFAHEARWNDNASRIEMHIVSLCRQTVTIADSRIPFAKGETIHTENSRKFEIRSVQRACARAGWLTRRVFTDSNEWFAVALMSADPAYTSVPSQ